MRPYIHGEDLSFVSVSKNDTPEIGGMIARGAEDGSLWYVSKAFFETFYKPAEDECDCHGAKFVRHIQQHLDDGEYVVCKICGKRADEID